MASASNDKYQETSNWMGNLFCSGTVLYIEILSIQELRVPRAPPFASLFLEESC